MTALFGCASVREIMGFKRQLERVKQFGRIEGKVQTEHENTGPLVVLLVRETTDEQHPYVAADTYVRLRPGSYAFLVAAGTYRVGAYEDRNHNGKYDPDESAARPLVAPPMTVTSGGVASQDILIPTQGRVPDLTESVDIFEMVARTPEDQRAFSLWTWTAQGEICRDLDALDRKRFQAWFYFYPPGFNLGSPPREGISGHLASPIERLQIKYGFGKIAIVAHSMGGLVARGAILKYYERTRRSDIRLLISISTPWGGDVRAVRAGDAPIELPLSFSDMNPKSDYQRWLFYEDEGKKTLKQLPPRAEFHIILRLPQEPLVEGLRRWDGDAGECAAHGAPTAGALTARLR